MKEEIKKVFRGINLDISRKGYFYWIEMINIASKEYKGKLGCVDVELLYERIARNNNTTKRSVSRAMYLVIEEHKEEIAGYFYYYENKITVKTFLLLMLEYLKGKGL